jgi:hypothetical protein
MDYFSLRHHPEQAERLKLVLSKASDIYWSMPPRDRDTDPAGAMLCAIEQSLAIGR